MTNFQTPSKFRNELDWVHDVRQDLDSLRKIASMKTIERKREYFDAMCCAMAAVQTMEHKAVDHLRANGGLLFLVG